MTVLLVGQRVDDVAKGRERAVDVLGLVQALTRRTRLGNLLTASKVYEVKFSHLDGAIVQVLLLDREHEDEVRPRRMLVHVGHGHRAVVVASTHGIEDLRLTPNVGLGDLPYEDAPCLVLMDLQVVLLGVEQVPYTLVVDLHDGDLDKKLDVLVGMVDPVKDRPDHSRDHTLVDLVLNVRSLHGVGLAAGSLTVREDRPIEAFEHGVDNGHRGVVIDLLLASVPAVDPVEDKGEVSVGNVHGRAGDSVGDLYADPAGVVPLHLVLRPEPAAYLDALLARVLILPLYGHLGHNLRR
mmetsp:Transcript_49485/g.132415  ORF Transcript_49485/g.132415 Transcript_49485/m.132415 type:complete len:295 (-) Transcript_49485:2-886(-)